MTDKVFVNDSVILTLNTNKVLDTFSILKIKFENPYGVKGNWPATQHPIYNTKMQALAIFDVDGIWKVQSFISDINTKFHGMWTDIKVYAAIAPDTTVLPTTMVPTTLAP